MRRATILVLGALATACANHKSPDARGVEPAPQLPAAKQSPDPGAGLQAEDAVLVVPPPESELPQVRVVLDDPRLLAAKDDVATRDWASAARAIEEARAKEAALGAEDARRWSYVAGRMHLFAGHFAEAARAFEAAAAGPWTLSGYAELRAAQAYLRAGDAPHALDHARAVPEGLASRDEVRLALAEALAETGARGDAVPLWRASIDASPRGPRWTETALRLADALLAGAEGPAEAHAEEALSLATRVVVEAPKIADSSGATALRTRAIALLRAQGKSPSEALTPDQRGARAQAWLDAGDAKHAFEEADALLAQIPKKPGDELACRVATTRAEAARGQKRAAHPEAARADAWGEAIARCAGTDAQAAALHFGAKASVAASRDAEALARFAKVEQDFPKSRFADDARFRGAELVRAMGDEPRALAMLASLPDAYPDGDLRHEALFEVALAQLGKGDLAAAKTTLDRAVGEDAHDHAWATAARAAYFRARISEKTGDREDAARRYAAIVSEEPLAYYMLQAYARLAGIDQAAARAALDAAVAREPEGRFYAQEHPELRGEPFVRAVGLLEVGETDAARHELAAAKLLGEAADPEVAWTAAWLFDAAGAPEIGHSYARGALTDYLAHYPAGRWKVPWRVAYPRAFDAAVVRASEEAAIPAPLTWAIMREESAFRPEARSKSNAIGLMQLMPATARWMAKGTSLPFDEDALERPDVSIALGTKLLGSLRRTYAQNPALAIAAYNAGSGSVRGWLRARGEEDFDLWVEQIPFEETRGYVKRVLRSEAAYAFLYDRPRFDELLALPARAAP